MDVVEWTRIESLFDEALGHPPEERSAWLRDACDGDTALHDRVATMLAADAAPARILGGRALDALYGGEVLQGQRIGPWRVAEHLGEGGMGTVYRAERADGPFEQTVALKLIKRGMDTDAVLRRFRAERRILARLEHPGIARLVDGGLSDPGSGPGQVGRPYLAMEYVEGEPITDACDRHRLGVDARLRLVEEACEAVAYAHQRLVIHRDLKPSNLLVVDTDDGPRVKLLDFGIAKVLAEDETQIHTRTGQQAFTPSYAAPEQLRGAAITTATDVYGLGAVLYRLLTGTRPTPTEGRSRMEVEMAVLTHDPALPSRVVRGQAAVAEARGTTPERLARTLAGDLDGILLRALRKDPAERYADARALLDDLRRYREGLPVDARTPSPMYRARKFVGRHRAAVAVAAVGVLAIGLVVALAFSRVSAERDLARTEAEKAEQVSTLLADLFAETDPAETPGADAFVRQFLAQGTARIDVDLADRPALRAQMVTVVGRMYRRRGLFPDADSLLGRALALRESLVGADHPDVADVLDEVGRLREDQGRYAEAGRLLARSLAIREATSTDDPLPLAATLHALASVNRQMGRYTEGEAQIRRAIALREAAYDGPHREIAASLEILGSVLMFRELNRETVRERQDGSDAERYAEAEAANLRAVAILREVLGPNHLDLASTLNSVGTTYRLQGRWAEAEPFFRDALRIWEVHYGPDYGRTALTRGHLALAVGMQGRAAESRSLHDEALADARRAFPSGHPTLTILLLYRGEMLSELDDGAEARPVLDELVGMYRPRLGTHAEATRGSLRAAVAYARIGRLATTERLIQEVDAVCEAYDGGVAVCRDLVRGARERVAGVGLGARDA